MIFDDRLRKDIIIGTERTFSAYFNESVSVEPEQSSIVDTKDGWVVVALQMNQRMADGQLRHEGTTYISFQSSGLKLIIQKFKDPELSLQDVAGETSNTIFGVIKQKMRFRDYRFVMDLPKIVDANAKAPYSPSQGTPGMQVNFNSPIGKLNICVFSDGGSQSTP